MVDDGLVFDGGQSAEAVLPSAALEAEWQALASARQQWEQTEKPALEAAVTTEARMEALADWEEHDKPQLEKDAKAAVRREVVTQLDTVLVPTLVKLDHAAERLRGGDRSIEDFEQRYADVPLSPGAGPKAVRKSADAIVHSTETNLAKLDAEWEAVRAFDRSAVDKAASAEFVRQSKNVKLADGRTAYAEILDRVETSYKTMHPEHKKGVSLRQFATETVDQRQARQTASTKRVIAAVQERNQANAAKRAATPDSQRPKPQGQ